MNQLQQDLTELLRRIEPKENWAKVSLKKSSNCGCILGHLYEAVEGPVPILEGLPSFSEECRKATRQVNDIFNSMETHRRIQKVLKALFPDPVCESLVTEAWRFNDAPSRTHDEVVGLVRDALARETAK